MEQDLGEEEEVREEDLVYKMQLTIKGKKSLNLLIKKLGKEKGRKLFYCFEKKRPDLTSGWRK